MKLPSFQFYPGDWQKDPNLKRCTKAEKGMWIDLICVAHECEERGVFVSAGRPWTHEEVAGAVIGDVAANLELLRGLLSKGVARIDKRYAIYCERMVRDEQKRKLCSEAGKRGGGNPTFIGHHKGSAKGHHKGYPKASVSSSSSVSSSKTEEPPPVGPPPGDNSVGTTTGEAKKPQPRAPEGYQKVIAHVWQTYKPRGWTWKAEDGKNLKTLLGNPHSPEALMGLWDVWISKDRRWTDASGRTGGGHEFRWFYREINRLVDEGGWKPRAEKYAEAGPEAVPVVSLRGMPKKSPDWVKRQEEVAKLAQVAGGGGIL